MQPRRARDPVCGRCVAVGPETPASVHRGRTFHFCSRPCRTVFEAFPEASLDAGPGENAGPPADVGGDDAERGTADQTTGGGERLPSRPR